MVIFCSSHSHRILQSISLIQINWLFIYLFACLPTMRHCYLEKNEFCLESVIKFGKTVIVWGCSQTTELSRVLEHRVMLNEAFSYWQHLKFIKKKLKASVHVLQKVAGTDIQISEKAMGLSVTEFSSHYMNTYFYTCRSVTVLTWRSQLQKYKF